jgi:hypothetical protein
MKNIAFAAIMLLLSPSIAEAVCFIPGLFCQQAYHRHYRHHVHRQPPHAHRQHVKIVRVVKIVHSTRTVYLPPKQITPATPAPAATQQKNKIIFY